MTKSYNELLAENERLRAFEKCPHGLITLRQYCRDCSMEKISQEYDHLEDLKSKLSESQAHSLALVAALKKLAPHVRRARDINPQINLEFIEAYEEMEKVLSLSPEASMEALRKIVGALEAADTANWNCRCGVGGEFDTCEMHRKIDAGLTTAEKVFGVKGDLR